MKRTFCLVVAFCTMLTLLSCAGASRQERGTGAGAAVGAGVGAILGQVIGRSTQGTVLGATIGAVVGGIAGNQIGAYMDRQERDLRDALAESESAARRREAEQHTAYQAAIVERTQDVLTATFQSEVLFDFDSATVKPGGIDELRRVAGILNRYTETMILVEGHTDAVGSEAYNMQLSQRRADAVKTVLVNGGVHPERIETVGYGKSRPISSDNAANRRVSIVIKPVVAKG